MSATRLHRAARSESFFWHQADDQLPTHTHPGAHVPLSVFACPKPFTDPHIAIIQRNAITSWTLLRPRPEITLFGNEEGTERICEDLNLRHVPEIRRNEFGTPLLGDLFRKANQVASNDLLCYVNADIILLSDFARAVARFGGVRCLLVGCRTDMYVSREIEFSDSNWERDLRAESERVGSLHSHRGMDYFLFPRGLWDEVPPFAIGRLAWDNWLVYDARRRGFRVVDATRSVKVIHQNHDHPPEIDKSHRRRSRDHPETQRNRELSGGPDHHYDVRDSTHVMLTIGTWPALGPHYLEQRLRRPPFRPWTPSLGSRLTRVAISVGLRAYHLLNRSRKRASRVS